MDILTNYPRFREDIEESFKDLINEFNLEFKELHDGCYLLKGLKCNIRFTYDRGDISSDFKQPSEYQDSPGYGVWAVYKFLYPLKESLEQSERIYDPRRQLFYYSDIVQKNLKNVLSGDFSWLEKFNEEKERQDKLVNLILHLDYNNPISQKFWKGDLSWQYDIEKYLIDNNIAL